MEVAAMRSKRLTVPWDEDTPDAKGFWNYVRDHYSRCITLACEIAKEHWLGSDLRYETIFKAVFDKLASPLVYLYEAWNVMNPEKKAKYSPEMQKIHEESRKLAEKIFPGPGTTG
jgi:hypothetical protein